MYLISTKGILFTNYFHKNIVQNQQTAFYSSRASGSSSKVGLAASGN
jgi:hypothetical protein